MKRTVLIFFGLATLAFSSNLYAQTDAEIIERALAGVSEQSREAASVIKWNADHTYETIKEGTNAMVCFDRSGEPGQPPFSVHCTSMANLPREAQNRLFAAESSDGDDLRARHTAAEEDGTRVVPEYGSLFISMRGADQASAGTHTTIAVPGATSESLGLPDNPRQGGAWIMQGGSSYAHIMTPGN